MSRAEVDVVGLAVAVVADVLARGVGPSEAMAGMPLVRAEPPAVRAAVLRLATDALAARRRVEHALQDRVSAAALGSAWPCVLGCLVERGGLEATAAARRLAAVTGARVAFPSAQEMESAVAAIDDPQLRFAVRHAVPDWLAGRFRAAYGDGADGLLRALAGPAPRTLRANLLRVGSREELRGILRVEGIDATPARFADTAVHVAGTADLFRTRAFHEGCFEQQDEASQLAVRAVAVPPGGKVLDLCCGSGGKSLALAAALRNRGAVLACDVSAARVGELRKRLPRAGCDNMELVHLDGSPAANQRVEAFARRADRILVDAPCSGTGSWRRRPEARWQVDEASLAALLTTQQELLDRAAAWLAPGARLVYATCSLLPEENEQQVEALRARHPELEVVRLAEVLGGAAAAPIADPGGVFLALRPDVHGCDGFFAAVLRRPRRRGA